MIAFLFGGGCGKPTGHPLARDPPKARPMLLPPKPPYGRRPCDSWAVHWGSGGGALASKLPQMWDKPSPILANSRIPLRPKPWQDKRPGAGSRAEQSTALGLLSVDRAPDSSLPKAAPGQFLGLKNLGHPPQSHSSFLDPCIAQTGRVKATFFGFLWGSLLG